MKYKNPEERKEIVRGYIQNNPGCTYLDIKRDTKIKTERLYPNLRDAYKDAGVRLSKNLTKRNKEEQKKAIIIFIKKNPTCTVSEVRDVLNVNIPRLFGSIVNAYKAANVEYVEKEVTSGVMSPEVVKRCNQFEKRIIKRLSCFGKVTPKVRNSNGIADCIFELNNKKYVVEIKDYRGKRNMTMYEVRQLIDYMKALNYWDGLLICPKESLPKRGSRNIYKENLKIRILSEEDLRGRSIIHLLQGK